MPKDNKIVVDGIITDILPNTQFEILVTSEANPQGFKVRGYISGRMRMNYIRIIKGDRVRIEVDPYDPSKGRIVYRYKDTTSQPFNRPQT